MKDNTSDVVDELEEMYSELNSQKKQRFLEIIEQPKEPEIPRVGWTTDLEKLKATVEFLKDGRQVTREEWAEHLNSTEGVKEVNSMHFGLVYRQSNVLFDVEKGDDRSSDLISLSEVGESLVDMFDFDEPELLPREITLYRGLHQYGNQYVFLGTIARYQDQEENHPDGILREDLLEEMKEVFGDSAENFVSYYATLFDRMELIERTKDGRKSRYKLTVPPEWSRAEWKNQE